MKIKNTFTIFRFLLITFFITASIVNSQTGKIVGKVTDYQTGEELFGANILIEGTNTGAATDDNGYYFILNITPGVYTLKARYIGYAEQIISNVRVYLGLTTEINFLLQPTEYQTETIVISSERPLIKKDLTGSTNVITSMDMKDLPIRGVSSIVSTQTGVVTKPVSVYYAIHAGVPNQGNIIYIRGSRHDAVAFYNDGVLVNNPVYGNARTEIMNNAVEEIQVQTGGYTAEFGGANGGLIITQSKTGTSHYNFTLEAITDNFVKTGTKFLGGYTYGYSELSATISGPVLPSNNELRFFVGGSNIFQRSPALFIRGFNFPRIYDPSLGELADTFDVYYPDGYRVNNHNNQYQFQGNLIWDLNPVSLRFNTSYYYRTERTGAADWWTSFPQDELVAQNSFGLYQQHTFWGSLKITHVLSPSTFYDVILTYSDDFFVSMDPFLKHNITAYGDSIINAAIGRHLPEDGELPLKNRAYGFAFDSADRPFSLYRKQRTDQVGGKLNFLHQFGKDHEFKVGAEIRYYTIRRYDIDEPHRIASLQRSIADGDIYSIYSPLNYGYDVYGNETDAGMEGANHPVFAGFYMQDKMEYSDLVINAGLRLDYIDTDSPTLVNPKYIEFIQNDLIDPDDLKKVDPFLQVSPRLGVSFPMTDKTVFYAQYGKFIQQSSLRNLYIGYYLLSKRIKLGGEGFGLGLRPERTTSYELGFRQQIGENFAFDITGFYKDIKDQIQMRPIFTEGDANHPKISAFVNGDFSTIKGFELKFRLRRVNRLSSNLNYTFSDAKGTGSTPSSARMILLSTNDHYFPAQIAPLDFNRTHSGFLNIDYRFGLNDGPDIMGSRLLSGFGVNLLFSFTSGISYTTLQQNRNYPVESLNASSSPWTFQVDGRIDKVIQIGKLDLNIYLWIINVFNTQNVIDVWPYTGDAYDDGYLTSKEGVAFIEGYRRLGEEYAKTYQDLYRALNYNENHFGPPRQLRLGLKLSY